MTEPEAALRSGAEIKATLERQGFMQLVGAEVDEIGSGFCQLSLRYRPEVAQHDGLFHGGAVAFLVDNAAAAAAATVVPAAAIVLTAEFKLNLFSPGRGDRLECRAEARPHAVRRSGASLHLQGRGKEADGGGAGDYRLRSAGQGWPEPRSVSLAGVPSSNNALVSLAMQS
jgi:uncharacterized protein (TIGR00369 family)